MAKKIKQEEKTAKEIKTVLEKGKAIIGTENTIKEMKKGNLKKIFLSSNCPEQIKHDLEYYSEIAGIDLVETEYTNEALGEICKKPFFISIIGVKQ